MALSAILACVVTSQRTLSGHATQTDDLLERASSKVQERLVKKPSKLNVKQPVHSVQLLARNERALTQKALVLAFQNDGGKFGSHGCTDDELFMPLEDTDTDSSNYSDGEIVSTSHSAADVFPTVDHLGNQETLLAKLKAVYLHVLASEQWNVSRLELCNRNYVLSATNLIHYLALKCLDLEQLKEDLSSVGLLNLETINSNVLASLTASIQVLENLKSCPPNQKDNATPGIQTRKRLDQHIHKEFTVNSMRKKASSNGELLLGPLRDGRATHIMVTVGYEAIESETLVADLLKAGTSIIRINCAHGNPSVWSEIIRRVKECSQMLEKPCRILMDLAGPKLRTGKLKPGPCVMKISPKKNAAGKVIFPAQVWLSHKGASFPSHLSPDVALFIEDQEFMSQLEVGNTLRFSDARGKKRLLKISRSFHVFSGTGYMAECNKTSYVQSGTEFYIKGKKGRFSSGLVVDVPAVEPSIRLSVGDLLIITRDSSGQQDGLSNPMSGAHRITCSSGYLFDSVKPGESIAFDDGKIWGVIQGISISEIIVSITHAGPRGTKLGSDKSINIPKSNIRYEGLTSKDLTDLEFVAAHADMMGISFVRDVNDIVVLHQQLEKKKLNNLGIILKIETKSGFEKLPLMLLEAMKFSNPLGVMIARGDLAVECGWERLADIQEEILYICSAAHIPVILATQVLESLVKFGVPTRAEITDAANGRRANCVMLNKGKCIVEAVLTLDTILHGNSTETKAELKPLLLSSHLF
ncbi:Pyruvate kinase family protein isoform 1 [Tripterygium wilfordii]|uniref:pyruvate kinase n=1 Tax=Tripterygium wilfordii TaxID=458696 RepID=A0A7J7DB02_TRIWF|nr:plastidial pyruvate kinase 4, chloroplastic [Tripterygium wilfordii]XP_038709479.1 plastidial pyruvate kinase 4, chloroplastic [Tripterygium wilfordii]KAF5743464.1 Pyruvate kinase family protein isoform 1 [Tripterygium wilfordii]